jgi:hypothetical protein
MENFIAFSWIRGADCVNNDAVDQDVNAASVVSYSGNNFNWVYSVFTVKA